MLSAARGGFDLTSAAGGRHSGNIHSPSPGELLLLVRWNRSLLQGLAWCRRAEKCTQKWENRWFTTPQMLPELSALAHSLKLSSLQKFTFRDVVAFEAKNQVNERWLVRLPGTGEKVFFFVDRGPAGCPISGRQGCYRNCQPTQNCYQNCGCYCGCCVWVGCLQFLGV